MLHREATDLPVLQGLEVTLGSEDYITPKGEDKQTTAEESLQVGRGRAHYLAICDRKERNAEMIIS